MSNPYPQPDAARSELREELRTAAVEPLLPIEKKLIAWASVSDCCCSSCSPRSITSIRGRDAVRAFAGNFQARRRNAAGSLA